MFNILLAPVSVMCVPLVLPSGDLLGVVEFYRNWKNATYTPQTVHTVQVRNDSQNVMKQINRNCFFKKFYLF